MASEVIKILEDDLGTAEEELERGRELVELGKDAGIDVSEEEAEIITLERQVARLRSAIEKRKE